MSAYDPKRTLRTTSVISSLALLTKVTIPCSNALQGLGTSRRSSLSAQWGRVVAVILLVEDEDQVRVLAESFLQTAGHTTLSAGSIEQALALLSSPEPIDLLFIDLNLKGESEAGLSLAGRATARKIGKMITRCKAETKAIKKLDDEQKNSYKDCEGVFSAPCRSPSLVPNEPKLV